uniref:Uncharacterized protein n=1 Tax=Xiphophorus couchianus TaxID=32473 RepID=A0A3B5MR57_9TELE
MRRAPSGRPSSYFLFLWYGLRLPPVLRRLCQLSLEIPGKMFTKMRHITVSTTILIENDLMLE